MTLLVPGRYSVYVYEEHAACTPSMKVKKKKNEFDKIPVSQGGVALLVLRCHFGIL